MRPLTTSALLLMSLLASARGEVLEASSVQPTQFEFIVIGDTRPKFESTDFSVFEGLLDRINALNPTLTINLGDLIYGYGRPKESQWKGYLEASRRIAVPYYQVPGNHDTFSKSARRAYQRHFSTFYQSFNAHGCHFVLLDNTEEGKWGYLGPKQFDWLKADLATNSCRPVFVFLHFPVWDQERVKPEYHDFWREQLHPLLSSAGVKAVFGGHFHCYGPNLQLDGIRYYITGGGGAELLPEYRKSGGAHHFIRVKVRGGDLDVRVWTDRGELTDSEADIMGGFRFASKHSSRIGVVGAENALRGNLPVSVTLENPYSHQVTATAQWRLDSSAFVAQPESAEVRLPAGASSNLHFMVRALNPTALLPSAPWLEFMVAGGGVRHRFEREVLFLQRLEAPLAPAPRVLDGNLQEWADSPELLVNRSGGVESILKASHDRQNVYLAFTIPHRSASGSKEEEEALPDDLLIGFAPRISATEFGGDAIRIGLRGDKNAVMVNDRTPGRASRKLSQEIKASRSEQVNTTSFELAFPLRLLPSAKSHEKNRFVISTSFPMPEPTADEAKATNTKNSFSYQVRYGGDTLVPVYFAEVVLQPR